MPWSAERHRYVIEMDGLFVSTSPHCVSPRSSGAPIVPLKAKTASPSSTYIVVCASNFPLASRQWLREDRAWPLWLCARHARGRKRKGRSQKTPHRGLATTCGVDGILVSACYVSSQKDLCTVLPLCVVTAAAHLNSPDTDVLYSPDQVGVARTLQVPDYSEPLWLRAALVTTKAAQRKLGVTGHTPGPASTVLRTKKWASSSTSQILIQSKHRRSTLTGAAEDEASVLRREDLLQANILRQVVDAGRLVCHVAATTLSASSRAFRLSPPPSLQECPFVVLPQTRRMSFMRKMPRHDV